MKFMPESLTKRFIRSLKKIMGKQYCMPQILICKLQRCGYLRSVQEMSFNIVPKFVPPLSSPDFEIFCFPAQLLVAGAAGGLWVYKKHRQNTNVHIMALNLVRGVPLTPKEKQTMLEILTPPAPEGTIPSWWRKYFGRWCGSFLLVVPAFLSYKI